MKIGILSRRAHLYSTRRLVEAAKARGHQVRVVDTLRCYMDITTHDPAVRYKGEELTGYDAIIPRIGASITFYGTAVVRQFEMMKVLTTVESQALIRSRDKLRSLQILSREGLGLPKTVFTNYSMDVDEILSQVLRVPRPRHAAHPAAGRGWCSRTSGSASSHRRRCRCAAPFASLNLGGNIGDDPAAVRTNHERMYAALKGHGGTVRLVMLPHESHGYRARESTMHTLMEMVRWMDLHVKNNAPEGNLTSD